MEKHYEQLFSRLSAPEPRPGLFGVIQKRIVREEKQRAWQRVILFSFGILGSLVTIVPVFRSLQASVAESGFMDFFSLAFSDAGMVATYWQNFLLTLLESLPAIGIAAFLATIFTFFGSLRFLTRDVKTLYYGFH